MTIKIDKGVSRIEADKNQKADNAIMSTPDANPSRPSVILNALANAIMTNAANGMESHDKFMTPQNGM